MKIVATIHRSNVKHAASAGIKASNNIHMTIAINCKFSRFAQWIWIGRLRSDRRIMKKILLRNTIIVVSLILLSIPCNYFVRHYAMFFSPLQFIPTLSYALLCGASLILMDLSNRRINIIFAAFYLVFSIVNIQIFSIFAYGPTVYWFVLMFGALLASLFKKETNLWRENAKKIKAPLSGVPRIIRVCWILAFLPYRNPNFTSVFGILGVLALIP